MVDQDDINDLGHLVQILARRFDAFSSMRSLAEQAGVSEQAAPAGRPSPGRPGTAPTIRSYATLISDQRHSFVILRAIPTAAAAA